MAKKSRTKARDTTSSAASEEVGPRQPCPCGSGRRYKACHGAPGGGAETYVARPFAGLPGECDIVAMRELVPAATAPVTIRTPAGETRTIDLCTLLPMAAPAMVREAGGVWLGLQVQHHFGDPSRDLAAVLLAALESEPGIVGITEAPGAGPRLQDLVTSTELEVTVHDGFAFWIADMEEQEGMEAALEQADTAAVPTARLSSVEAAYWTRMGAKEHLRWVMPEPEDQLLDALARLHASGADSIAPESRFVGMFRAHGLLAPVWDLPVGTGPEPLEEAAARLHSDLRAALADTSALTSAERSARNGLTNRQVTIR